MKYKPFIVELIKEKQAENNLSKYENLKDAGNG